MHDHRFSQSLTADLGETDREKMAGGVFYHGTSKRNARKVLDQGFCDRSWTAETPLMKYKAARGKNLYMHGGHYGRGTYISCNWQAALHFGPVLFRVKLQEGTRIVRIDEPVDGKVIDSLKREFGKEILTKSPRKVMAKNKRLTLNEAVQLARYHAEKKSSARLFSATDLRHNELMLDLRNILVRYGIQGWGEPSDLCGIVIFATDRLKVTEVVLSVPQQDLWWNFRNPVTSGQGLALESMIQVCRNARNRGAANTLEWVKQSNEKILERYESMEKLQL